MNIDIVGRIRPSHHGESPHSLQLDSQHTVTTGAGGVACSFQYLHKQDAGTHEVYQKSVQSLLDLSIAGFNTCLLVTGESGSGKASLMAGESVATPGIIPTLMEQLFQKIGEDERYLYDSRVDPTQRVHIQMYEIYNELVRDLLQTPGMSAEYLEQDENPERGPFVKNGKSVSLPSAVEGITTFRQGWARRTDKYTDFGPAKNHSTIIIFIDLVLHAKDSPLPNKSRLTVVVTPGTEKLALDSSQLRLKEGPTLSKSMVSLSQLTQALANQPFPDRIISYGESKLTFLLRDELGGNCKTRVLMCFKPHSETSSLELEASLNFANQLNNVKNFPIPNDPFTQHLLMQYRARTQNLQQQLGFGAGMAHPSTVHDKQEELRRVQTDNITLRDQNERLHQKLEQLQGKFGNLATTKSDLSAQLLMTEEEKLKVSKTMVDMQIENNKLKEELEATKFEHTNKVLQLEHSLMELELERDKLSQTAKNATERLSELERDRKELADEYVALKTNYMAIKKAHERETSNNEELRVELLNLVNAKAALVRQMENMELAHSRHGSPSAEVDRVRAIVSRMSTTNPNDLYGNEKARQAVEKDLFGNQEKFEGEMHKLRGQYDSTNNKLQNKILLLKKDAEDSRNLARDRQRKISELNAHLITVKSQRDQLQSENNRMQHKLKDINEEFRSRLIKYLEDIAEYIDSKKRQTTGDKTKEMRQYVEDMLRDMKKAHKVREEQLSEAAQSFRVQLTNTARKHEELLVAYRELRSQLEERGYDDLDLGPKEEDLKLSDRHLTSSQEKEIFRLKEQLGLAHNEVEALKIRLRMGEGEKTLRRGSPQTPDYGEENWADLRKQMRQFSLNTQRELEQERAEMLTKLAVLEEENNQLQQYIDSHLLRYKEEISRLRGMLGVSDVGGFDSPGPLPNRHATRRR